MNDITSFDNFALNPITSFKNSGYYKHRAGWTWKKTNEFAVLYCIESGVCHVKTDTVDCVCASGDVIFIKDFENVCLTNASDEDFSYYFISFFCKSDFDFKINTVTKNANALRLFKDVSKAHRSGAYLSKIKVAELFLRLIYLLCSNNFTNSKDYADHYKLLSVVEYINVNYYKQISLAQLSKISGYSPAHLRRLFVKNFGVPPSEYVLNKKIEMTKEILLDAPEKTTEEIANLVGFCSASYLCKLFKRNVGCTPLEYKKTTR